MNCQAGQVWRRVVANLCVEVLLWMPLLLMKLLLKLLWLLLPWPLRPPLRPVICLPLQSGPRGGKAWFAWQSGHS